ncbi:MAG: alpha-hydroxy-acid oxidizing protein [Bauldia sp.]|uniref:alpha-hydroxy acid oxidase n=1 Tax=Bauldia sp. TaxID=2575872 RepID=UPI001DDEB3C7|nr:alpha-hydroxy acid oxidase [Bauldia sp.]MCB1496763.1 alpha-hydroxy-acid oxidizing protein [Bauldia sp.]
MTPESLRRINSVAQMRAKARQILPTAVFDLADGAAEDEWTLRRNESAFDDIQLLPRPLDGAATRDLSVTLFGHTFSMPLMIGPTGLSGLFWPQGEQCAARAAAAAGTGFVLSHGSVCTIEDLAVTGASPRFMQVFIYKDRGFTRELAERAAAAGYDGLVLTIDNQLGGNRERDIKNGFVFPPRMGPVEIGGMAVKPGWLWRMRQELSKIGFGNYVREGEKIDLETMRMIDMLDPGMTWKDVDDLRKVWKGPLILKGVMHPDEGRRAPDHGVDGVIVSNHGGRQLDGAASSIEALPGVVSAIGGKIPVLVDGGIRRGVDAVRALTLGASACLIGRPQLFALAVAGEEGVARVLDIYRSEIDRVMAFCGAKSIAGLGPELLLREPWR